jgi:hypothetical protein
MSNEASGIKPWVLLNIAENHREYRSAPTEHQTQAGVVACHRRTASAARRVRPDLGRGCPGKGRRQLAERVVEHLEQLDVAIDGRAGCSGTARSIRHTGEAPHSGTKGGRRTVRAAPALEPARRADGVLGDGHIGAIRHVRQRTSGPRFPGGVEYLVTISPDFANIVSGLGRPTGRDREVRDG